MRISRKPWRTRADCLLAAALAASCGPAAALIDLDLQDGASATVQISRKDPTRLTVEGAPILEVIGSSVRSDANPAGTLLVSRSAERGDAYVMPVENAPAGATSVFVATARGTYTLVLAPQDIHADTVVIRDRRAAATAGEVAAPRPYNRERELFELLRAVANDEPPPALRLTEIHQPVTLWQEVRFTHERRYTGDPHWTVDVYLLTNISTANLVLDEREFVTADVAAVGLEQADLAPGQSTLVRVVRARAEARP